MIGIPLNNLAYIHGDNQSVLWNMTVPESTLKKKSLSVAYHYIRERCAIDSWRIGYMNTKLNPSDILTKTIALIFNRIRKFRMLLYDIYP